jgi:Calcineurin-like phosphoesterase
VLTGAHKALTALWHKLLGHAGFQALGPIATQRDGPVIHELLDPDFLRSQLQRVQEEGSGALSQSPLQEMYAKLDEESSSPRVGASAEQGAQAMLPNLPSVSIFQSTLTDCVTSRLEDLVKPLPVGKRSFAEFVLRETDVFRKFGPCDARWIESVIAEGVALFEGRPPFPDGRAPDVPLADDARVVVVGDWGTGLPGARAVGQQMASRISEARGQGREVHALHLGDVYYSGWREEYEARFTPFWPVVSPSEGVASWALNGNHDMYSGGHGYFGHLLSHPLFRAQNRSSYFCLQNDHWQLLGLDTAYEDRQLAGEQVQWVIDKQQGDSRARRQRKTMLLTHHQPFSAFEEVKHPFLEQLKPAFDVRPVDAWLWGHEHMCCVYQPNLMPYLGFGSCIGHGGVPIIAPTDAPPADRVKWRFEESEVHEGGDVWLLFGFAVLDFAGPAVDIRYYDQHGQQAGEEQVIE